MGVRPSAIAACLLTISSAVIVGVAPPASAAACAPTVSDAGGDVVLTFSAVGTCEWTVPAWVGSVRVLVVAGGGGGGVNYRGGGGAGGMLEDTSYSVAPGATITIAVGAGGTGAYYGPAYAGWWHDQFVNTVSATNGGHSSFDALVAVGGGFGSGCYGGTLNAGNGGSGGGSTGCTAGTGTVGQGSNGSTTGGGGGAGGAPTTSGGAGRASDITGSPVTYAGGGGRQGATGGSGGGGAGANGAGNSFAQPGTDGLGGGGGGGGYFPDGSRLSDNSNDTSIGGRGGSGVVIVRHAPAPPPPPEPILPGPPLNVVATPFSGAVYVRWGQPASAGSYPITHYLVTFEPGGRTCLVVVPATSCTVHQLRNGTAYSATVKALTGAGWGPASEPSNSATPAPPPPPSIAVTVTRTPGDVDLVTVAGRTTAIKAGTQLYPYVHQYGPQGMQRFQGSARPVVAADGSFTWKRLVGDSTVEVIWCTEPMKKGICSPWTLL